MTHKFILAVAVCALAGASTAAVADPVAKHVAAEEIVGVVVEAGTGKPIANAVVAIRFERGNTGHASPHCFRSMAVEADAQGRFRFAPWTQDDTRADGTFGELESYKPGYVGAGKPTYVTQATRSILGIPLSDTIKIPRQELRLELQPFTGTDQERMEQLRILMGRFTCRWQAESDDMTLITTVRKEIAESPLANRRQSAGSFTPLEWIDNMIRTEGPKK